MYMLFKRLTWYSDPFLLVQEGIDGKAVEWRVHKGTQPCHSFKPITQIDSMSHYHM